MMPRLRGMLTATYVRRMSSMSYVSMAYLPRCFRMRDVCTAYWTCHLIATKCIHEKRSTLAYDSMSYVLMRMCYVCSRMYDVRATYHSYLDKLLIRESIRNSVTAL